MRPSFLIKLQRAEIFSLSLGLLLTLAVGCSSPIEQAYTTRKAVNSALADATTAHQSHKLSDKSFNGVIDIFQQVRPELDAEDAAAIQGQPLNFTYYSVRAKAKLKAMLLAYLTNGATQ